MFSQSKIHFSTCSIVWMEVKVEITMNILHTTWWKKKMLFQIFAKISLPHFFFFLSLVCMTFIPSSSSLLFSQPRLWEKIISCCLVDNSITRFFLTVIDAEHEHQNYIFCIEILAVFLSIKFDIASYNYALSSARLKVSYSISVLSEWWEKRTHIHIFTCWLFSLCNIQILLFFFSHLTFIIYTVFDSTSA